MSEQGINYKSVIYTTTQPVNAINQGMSLPLPTLRQYLREQERDLLQRLQRIRDLLVQLPKE